MGTKNGGHSTAVTPYIIALQAGLILLAGCFGLLQGRAFLLEPGHSGLNRPAFQPGFNYEFLYCAKVLKVAVFIEYWGYSWNMI